jgi:hypothetical protein
MKMQNKHNLMHETAFKKSRAMPYQSPIDKLKIHWLFMQQASYDIDRNIKQVKTQNQPFKMEYPRQKSHTKIHGNLNSMLRNASGEQIAWR